MRTKRKRDGEKSVSGHILSCAKCGRRELDPGQDWVALVIDDDEVALFCPDCAAREQARRSG
jgi:hypothetical protein